ncbi:hypothetical protein FRC01_001203 [Tulasnella sp. 417]|nr:hypothetical protein FRC01_001203 [Tulasnella sp. 417]
MFCSDTDLSSKEESQLPGVIVATKDGMIASFTTMAVVATLLASTEGVFLSIIKSSLPNPSSAQSNPSPEPSSPTNLRAMVILTYLAIVLNIGASWSALRMIDILGKMTFLVAKQTVGSSPEGSGGEKTYLFKLDEVRDVAEVMRKHGIAGIWSFFSWHCVVSLCLGSLCVIAQILLYIWTNEDWRVSIVVTLLAFITSTPIFLSLFL